MDAYVVLFLLIFVINVIPAFMPPTWIILSFIYLEYHLSFFPTVVIAVIAATSGRVVLAQVSRRWFRTFVPKRFLANYEDLGRYLSKHEKLTIPAVLGYSFSPISSNVLFIVAGLSELNLTIISFSFLFGRLISYSFWVTASYHITMHLEDIFFKNATGIQSLLSAVLSVSLIVLIGKINWRKLLRIKKSTT